MNYDVTLQHDFVLESGECLRGLVLRYTTHGQLNAKRDNVVWVCHAFTANADPCEWWPGVVGEGCVIDAQQHFIVCVNMIGSCYGSSGPQSTDPAKGSAYGSDFPMFTVRDIVHANILVRKHLRIEHIQLCIGASMGAQQVLEWAIIEPDVHESIVIIAAGAVQSAWAKAFNAAQRLTLEADASLWTDSAEAGHAGMVAARSIAMLSYRNYAAFVQTQSDKEHVLGTSRAESYLRYQGRKLVERFNAQSYWYLSKSMDSHDCARGRGDVYAALSSIRARCLIVGISSDVLFPIPEQRFLAEHIPDAEYYEIESDFGHDGFLVEAEQLSSILQNLLSSSHSNRALHSNAERMCAHIV